MRLLKERPQLVDTGFHWLAVACRRARILHSFFLTAWVFLPDHWHVISAPAYPLTISLVMKSIKTGSPILINRGRAESGELWQGRFFDRALRTVKEYNEKVWLTDPVCRDRGSRGGVYSPQPGEGGFGERPQDWQWSSVNEYSGMSATEQGRSCGLTIGRVKMPSDPRTRT